MALHGEMCRHAAWGFVLGLPLLMWVTRRLNHTAQRVQILAAKLAAGTLRSRTGPPRERPRRAPVPRPAADGAAAPKPPRPALPQGFAWLLRQVQGMEPVRELVRRQLTGRQCQLQHLLAQPDMLDLLRAAPAIGRELRPLCRMLGVAVAPGTFPPPRRRRPKPAPATPARPQPPKPPKPDRLRDQPRTLSHYGPPSRPGWERPVRGFLPPPGPGPKKSA
jgi:hypothetical protein